MCLHMQRPDGTARQFLQRVICLVLGHEVVYKETILILDSQSPVSIIKKPSRIRCTTHGGVAGPLSKYSFSPEIVVIETHHEDKVTQVCCELIEIHNPGILLYMSQSAVFFLWLGSQQGGYLQVRVSHSLLVS